MAAQVSEEERSLDSVNRARAPLESALEAIDSSVGLAEAGMDVSEVVGGDELEPGTLVKMAEDLARLFDTAREKRWDFKLRRIDCKPVLRRPLEITPVLGDWPVENPIGT